MPTYEYVCQSCGHRFDVWQKISDEPIQTCPVCDNAVRRVIFPVGLMFKGPGFYSTDSRGTATVASGHSDDAPAKAGDDAKPAAAKTGEPKTGEPKTGEPKTGESKAAAPATSKSSTTNRTSE
jgi:putative FmdB family regulatory protein